MAERDELAVQVETLVSQLTRRISALERELSWLRDHVRQDPTIYAAARLTSNVTIADDTLTELIWDDIEEDAWGMISGSALVAPRDGIYVVTAFVRWSVNSLGMRRTALRYYDTTATFIRPVGAGTTNGASGREADAVASAIVRLQKDEQIRVGVIQTSGGNLDVIGYQTRVSMFLLRA